MCKLQNIPNKTLPKHLVSSDTFRAGTLPGGEVNSEGTPCREMAMYEDIQGLSEDTQCCLSEDIQGMSNGGDSVANTYLPPGE